jgi:hypothetical protein
MKRFASLVLAMTGGPAIWLCGAGSARGGQQGAKPKGEVVADILAAIKERRA